MIFFQEDYGELSEIYKWDPSGNISYDQLGLTCVSDDSPYRKWIQTLGFQFWSKNNCEHIFRTAFLTSCSVIRTNGVEGGSQRTRETHQINDESNSMAIFSSRFRVIV